MSIPVLVSMSRKYGGDPAYVLAGGGNTSYKTGQHLYVKKSGTSLGHVTEDDFVKLDREKLADVWGRAYPEDEEAREAAALADLLGARCVGEENKRPSVETLLHDILPFAFVCHLHPAVVNGLTCAQEGQAYCARLFPGALWVPAIMPGFILARALREGLAQKAKEGNVPHVILIQNHGVFAAADTVEEIDILLAQIMHTLREQAQSYTPDLSACEDTQESAALLAPALRGALMERSTYALVTHEASQAILACTKDAQSFASFRLDITPDHMVYCREHALFVEGKDETTLIQNIAQALRTYENKHGGTPALVAMQGMGFFACAGTKAENDIILAIARDALCVAAFAIPFGGLMPMPRALTDAIAGWEVERYRKAQMTGTSGGRLTGKIAIVTGAAQGFGLGIAEDLAKEGAHVVLADLQEEKAMEAAHAICHSMGSARAFGMKCDVGKEDSVKALMQTTARMLGGVDLLVSNAGILRAGGVEEMSLASFELMSKVNYTAFFLCVKYASLVMKATRAQHRAYIADILQINSKSGLVGSKKNFAYAGGKFGGIGLVQSFALELIEENIKVNAICPGNFFEGPLWSDPENGLFAQYLAAGKVPGAQTVADVKAFYEAKVPMGRGCSVIDVTRAILYAVEQEYETGQAIPVTGGQEMLH